jgi:hypothetical protein
MGPSRSETSVSDQESATGVYLIMRMGFCSAVALAPGATGGVMSTGLTYSNFLLRLV